MTAEGKVAFLINLCAGAGIGSLVGLVMGLSASPVTSTILGSLSAGLLVLLGLTATRNGGTASQQSATVAAFGLSCTILLLIGVYLRSHDTLALSLDEQDRRLRSVFPDASDRRRILLFENYGLLMQNENSTITNTNAPSAEQTSKNAPNSKSDLAGKQAKVEQPAISTGFSPAAGYLRNGIADHCSYSQRKKFANLQTYLSFLHRTDARLAALIEAQPSQVQDQLSYALSDYLCP
jgi:hypothetical protein